jgi:hypothetical protein
MPIRKLTSDNGTLQWQVQQGAVDGSIYDIKVTSGGIGSTNVNNLVVTITGDGQSATATANINTVSQTVSSITLTDYRTVLYSCQRLYIWWWWIICKCKSCNLTFWWTRIKQSMNLVLHRS